MGSDVDFERSGAFLEPRVDLEVRRADRGTWEKGFCMASWNVEVVEGGGRGGGERADNNRGGSPVP